MTRVAIIQEAPCILDKKGTIKKAVEIIRKVSSEGAKLIVFPEAFISRGFKSEVHRNLGSYGIAIAAH